MKKFPKFQKWLNDNPGMATLIQKKQKVGACDVSNVKHGRIALPVRWIPAIVELSGGKFTTEELLNWRLSLTKR